MSSVELPTYNIPATNQFARILQIMEDVRSSQQNHVDYGDIIFHGKNFSVTDAPNSDLFPERDDSWSIIWYIASFSGLIAFFLIVSCSEWCCRLYGRAPGQHQQSGTVRPTSSTLGSQSSNFTIQETPPPAYDLFAPPSYESVHKTWGNTSSYEKSEFDVYVVPVHAIRMLSAGADEPSGQSQSVEDAPPSYISVQISDSAMVGIVPGTTHTTSTVAEVRSVVI